MKSNEQKLIRVAALGLFAFAILLAFLFAIPSPIPAFAQQPTGSIATVTGTPEGATVIVYTDQNIIGVFAGPSAYLYPQVGILLAGEEAPALGYSEDREWIQIVYLGASGGKGWIYAPFVAIFKGSELPVLLNPPTATPRTTPTIDPTRVAEFGVQQTPERLPTFTQPAPLEIPQFDVSEETRPGFPMGLIILLLALVGILGAVISFLRGR